MVTPSSGSGGRTNHLVRLGFRLAGSYLGYQLQRPFLGESGAKLRSGALRRKQARQVREKLQVLRGPIMKVGQALSMQTHLLSGEMVEELSALQMQAPPMHSSLMRAQFKSALGKYPEELFRSFEPEPFAAASLGQVHWAVTRRGQEVAVKIQYPAMREAIESDFRALRAAGLMARLTGHLPEAVIREAHRGIMEETDYLHEAASIDYFRKALAPLPFVRVPRSASRLKLRSRADYVSKSRICFIDFPQNQSVPGDSRQARRGLNPFVFLPTVSPRSPPRRPTPRQLPLQSRWDH